MLKKLKTMHEHLLRNASEASTVLTLDKNEKLVITNNFKVEPHQLSNFNIQPGSQGTTLVLPNSSHVREKIAEHFNVNVNCVIVTMNGSHAIVNVSREVKRPSGELRKLRNLMRNATYPETVRKATNALTILSNMAIPRGRDSSPRAEHEITIKQKGLRGLLGSVATHIATFKLPSLIGQFKTSVGLKAELTRRLNLHNLEGELIVTVNSDKLTATFKQPVGVLKGGRRLLRRNEARNALETWKGNLPEGFTIKYNN